MPGTFRTGSRNGVTLSEHGPLPPPFAGGGAMGAQLAAIDWSSHPLGPVESWPQSLRTALSIVLRSQFPMFVFWGEDLIQLYNDAYIPVLGAKHPGSQAAPARTTWAEIWDVLGPLVQTVVQEGRATWNEDELLLMERYGFVEETYFTFSYSPVEDESGGIGGVFCACTETTARVLADRRIRTVRELADATSGSQSVKEACELALTVLSRHREDLPVVALYVTDPDTGDSALAGTVGVPAGSPAAPQLVAGGTDRDDPLWPIADAAVNLVSHHVPDLTEVAAMLERGPWDEPPREAVIRPLADPTSGTAAGVLVAGLTPRQRLDDPAAATFVDLVADTLTKSLVDANAREHEHERLRALAELNQAKTEFFSNVSHEFRTPLTLILGPLEDALAAGDGLYGPTLSQVQRNARRLLKLVNTLLEFSRVEAGRQLGRFTPTDLSELTEAIASSFRSAVESAGLTYLVGCEPLPEPVHVDQDLWETVVLNLISNALKFTQEGSIEVTLRDEGGSAVLEVRDSGAGIAPEDREHLFVRFFRSARGRARTHEGSGIGLALVRELVHLHGGSIDVDSTVGEGSCFRVQVPYGHAHLPSGPAAAEPRDELDARVGNRRSYVDEATGWIDDVPEQLTAGDAATVLVVDDNADMRRYLTEILGRHWNVTTAADGQTALTTVLADRPDLLVTDVMMPGLDGFALVRELRRDPQTQDLPILVLSARAGEESSGQGLDAGADDYIVKPFTADQLVTRVRANLRMARIRSDLAEARGRTQLLAGVSHDMQTPLALILGVLSELANDDLPPAERRELVGIARTRAEHVKLLVQQFVDHAHLEAGQPVRVRRADVDALAAAERAVELLAEDRIEVAAAEPVVADADADRVMQVLVNLLQNAVAYTSGRIVVEVRRREDRAEIRVIDEGPGVPDGEFDRLFERYFRGSNTGDHTGSGLGLHVSREVARRMGGDLRAERAGNGTCVILELPASG